MPSQWQLLYPVYWVYINIPNQQHQHIVFVSNTAIHMRQPVCSFSLYKSIRWANSCVRQLKTIPLMLQLLDIRPWGQTNPTFNDSYIPRTLNPLIPLTWVIDAWRRSLVSQMQTAVVLWSPEIYLGCKRSKDKTFQLSLGLIFTKSPTSPHNYSLSLFTPGHGRANTL